MPEEINPPYVDNYLAHYGVRGMRWGKSGSSSGGSAESKPEGSHMTNALKERKRKVTTADIKAARKSQFETIQKMNRADAQSMFESTAKGRAKAEKAFKKYEAEAFDSDNAKIANKMTKGEKVLNTAAWTTYGALTVGTIGIMATSKRR